MKSRSIGFFQMTAVILIVAISSLPAVATDPPAPKPLKLEGKMVCVGDSITAGEGVKPAQSYVGLLKAKAAAGRLHLEVIGQGRSGWSTGSFVGSKEKILKDMPADATIVTIMLGTNDSHDDGSVDDIARKAADNLARLIDIYREKVPEAQFVIVAPTRIYPDILTRRLVDAHYGPHSVDCLKAIAAAYKTVAADRGLPFIDLAAVPSTPARSIDGVHPNAAGHAEIFGALWKGFVAHEATTRP
jgi:acyl-CoA thioesterase-1